MRLRSMLNAPIIIGSCGVLLLCVGVFVTRLTLDTLAQNEWQQQSSSQAWDAEYERATEARRLDDEKKESAGKERRRPAAYAYFEMQQRERDRLLGSVKSKEENENTMTVSLFMSEQERAKALQHILLFNDDGPLRLSIGVAGRADLTLVDFYDNGNYLVRIGTRYAIATGWRFVNEGRNGITNAPHTWDVHKNVSILVTGKREYNSLEPHYQTSIYSKEHGNSVFVIAPFDLDVLEQEWSEERRRMLQIMQ